MAPHSLHAERVRAVAVRVWCWQGKLLIRWWVPTRTAHELLSQAMQRMELNRHEGLKFGSVLRSV